MDYLVGIVIPVYNCESYLERCLKSVKEQSFSDFVVVLIDDGSKDNSAKICEKFCAVDKRFVYLYQRNQGVSTARNTGLNYLQDNCSVNRIAMIDSDDILHKDYIKILYETLDETGAVISGCNSATFYRENLNKVSCAYDKYKYKVFQAPFTKNAILPNSVWCYMFDSKLLSLEGYRLLRFNSEMTFYEDILFMSELFIRAKSFVKIGSILYYYRLNPKSICSNTNFKRRYSDAMKMYSQLKECYQNKNDAKFLIGKSKVFTYEGWLIFRNIYSQISRGYYTSEDFITIKKQIKYMRKDLFRVMFSKYIPFKDKKSYPFLCILPKLYVRLQKKKINSV